jgi:hypothetical protein
MSRSRINRQYRSSEEEQTQVAQQLAQIQNLQQLAELSQLFLQMATLDEFTKWVATYLPSHNPQ